jgi:predicted HAD superfamily Cof-like phosphohydrolase
MDREIKDVKDFAVKFGQLNYDRPGHITNRKATERVQFLLEELIELTMGFGMLIQVGGIVITTSSLRDGTITFLECDTQDLGEQADALVDLVYVAKGTAIMLGLPWDMLWDDVQRANMAKVHGIGKRGHLMDAIKPAGWEPPITDEILKSAGYREGVEGKVANYRDDQVHLIGGVGEQ